MDQFSHEPYPGPDCGEAEDDAAPSRNEGRDSLFLTADLRVAGRTAVQPVRVRNLSAGGLMAEYSAELPQGLDVEFDVRGIGWVPGRVAWSAAGRIGVSFAVPIDPMLARKPVGVAPKAPEYSKPNLKRR